jgi:hypothetical protein
LATTPSDIEGVTTDANHGAQRPTASDVNPVNGLIVGTVAEAPSYGEPTKHIAADVNTPRLAGLGAMEGLTAEFCALNASASVTAEHGATVASSLKPTTPTNRGSECE